MKSHRTYERIKQATGIDCLKEMAGAASVTNIIKALNARTLKGYQIRYLYILDPAYKNKLNVPTLSYDEIKKLDLPEGLK
jgi:leucyl aminopeptidase